MIRFLVLILFILNSYFNQVKGGNNSTIIPKPQKITINYGVFHLSENTGIKYDSLFISEMRFLKSKIPFNFTGDKNYIILKRNSLLSEEEYYLNISEEEITIESSTG